MRAGEKLKEAKNFNNAIHEPFFKLPLSQVSTKELTNKIETNLTNQKVSPPGLHITLGIFYRLFSLLEDACHKLDLKVLYEDSAEYGGWTFTQCARAFGEQTALREKANK